jgi:hypothetical protein
MVSANSCMSAAIALRSASLGGAGGVVDVAAPPVVAFGRSHPAPIAAATSNGKHRI